MRIAIYSDNFYPEMSGISDSIAISARELGRKGHRINFYVPRYSRKNFLTSKLKPREIDLGENVEIIRLFSIPYPPAPTKQGRFVLPILSSFRHIKKFNPDIIYTNHFFGTGLEALFVSRLLKKPLVGTNHTPIKEFLKYSPVHWRWIDKMSLKYVSWYYNQCNWITAPSQSIISDMKQHGFKKESRVLSSPIELSQFQPISSEEKRLLKKKFELSSKTILYTGRLAKEKNIDMIIRALAIVKKTIPEITLAITGHGSAKKELNELVQKLDLDKQAIFYGYVKPNEFAQLYQASDIFTIMSTAETQCMSMMQAMATGIPVIGADAWGVPEYINSQNGYVVQPGDYKALAQKIIYLFKHPEDIQKLGQGGIEYVKNFSTDKIAAEWEDIFQAEVKKNKSDLKLSFVIPAWNEEKYIGQCLESIIKEAKKHPHEIEIIVVNNASIDRTGEIASSFSEVKVIFEPQKGLPRARQAGFLASSGQLIANMDADSVLPPKWIDKVIKEFSKNKKLVALSGPYIYYDLAWTKNMLVHSYYFFGYLLHLMNHRVLKKAAMLQGGNFVLERSALEKVGGFDVNIPFYGEDTDIARRIQKVGRVKFTFRLPMQTSARRLAKEGIIKMGIKYFLNHFWVILFKKPFTRDYIYVGGEEVKKK